MDVPAQVASTAAEGGVLAAAGGGGGGGGGVGEGGAGAGAAGGGGGGGAAAAGGGGAGGGDYGGAGAGAACAAAGAVSSTKMPGFLPCEAENTHVAEKPQGGARTSIAWRFFEKFFPPLEDGKNVKCTLKRDDGTDCKALYKHDNEANTGTGSMVRHLRRCKDASHAQAIQEFDAESKHYSSGAAAKGVTKGAGKGAGRGAGKGARSSAPAKEERKEADYYLRALREPIAKKQTARLHKKYVTWCILNSMPLQAIDQIGFKMIIAELDPAHASTAPSMETLERVLQDMYGVVKAGLIEIFRSVRDDNRKQGYDGPFCSLRLDRTSKAGVEYVVASVQLVRPGSKTSTRLSLGARSCPGHHSKIKLIRWIEEMTAEYFGEGALPKEVFISATADEASNVFNACWDLGVITIPCRGDRLNCAVMGALGIDGAGQACKTGATASLSGDDESADTCKSGVLVCGAGADGSGVGTTKNAAMKRLVGKCAALVRRVCRRSGDNDEVLRNQGTEQQNIGVDSEGLSGRGTEEQLEVDHLILRHAEVLEIETAEQSDPETPSTPGNTATRRNDIRWLSTVAMMEKLVTLRDPISDYFRVHPDMAHLGLSPEEWRILTEVCGVLDLFKYVNTAMEGGTADGFIARSVFLCNTLLELLGDGTTNIINHCGVAGASGVHTPITDLHGTTTKFIEVAVEDLKQRNVHVPETDVELLGMFLDPRYKSLDGDACGGEGHAERLTLALANIRDSLKDRFLAFPSPPEAAAELTVRPATTAAAAATATATTSAKRPAELDEDPFAEYSRKRKKRAAAAASAAAVLCTVANRFEKEISEYKSLPDIAGSKFDLLSFWEDAAKPRLDENGNVVEVARFPILAMLSRVFHSADTTSYQPEKGAASFQSERGTAGVQSGRDAASFQCEGELSEVVRGMENLRKSMRRDGIETMMFLKLNQRFIPEVHSHAQNVYDLHKVQSDGY